ncbi:MAG: hypothetical protein E7375_02300 [Clostridiales bacterium]|nr:hypothetical protein [Clostridiales bacterium]
MKKEENKQQKRETKKSYKGAVIGLTIATSILGASTLGLGIAYGMANSQASQYSLQLENIYKKNYYELVDNINGADMKISKLLVADSDKYIAKMLTELSQSAKEMQNNIAALPLSGENIMQSVRFINQMSGYTQVLEEKLAEGGTLSERDYATLNEMHESLTDMKKYMNQMSQQMINGYSILRSSSRINGAYDEFSIEFAQIKADDADFPTMIYDGPFADSIVNQEIKGLTGKEISKDEAYKKVDSIFKNTMNMSYDGQTNGRFNTYNFMLMNSNNQKIYVQASKKGGHIITVSGNVESDMKNIDFAKAKKIALDFAKENGVEDAEVVWSEELNSQAYFNIAPTQNGIVLYPDLVKVKVDMENAEVIGYDAISYWTNHTKRNLPKASLSVEDARKSIDQSFEIKNERKTLTPLDYNREVLCYEFECEKNGATYYIYINAETGIEENILKVVETSDGSKLM